MEIIKADYMEVLGYVYYLLTSISPFFAMLVTSIWHLLRFQLIVGRMVMLLDSENLLLSLSNTTTRYERSDSSGFGLCSFSFLVINVWPFETQQVLSPSLPSPTQNYIWNNGFLPLGLFSSAMPLEPIELSRYWSAWWVELSLF